MLAGGLGIGEVVLITQREGEGRVPLHSGEVMPVALTGVALLGEVIKIFPAPPLDPPLAIIWPLVAVS